MVGRGVGLEVGRCHVPWMLMRILPSGTCDSQETSLIGGNRGIEDWDVFMRQSWMWVY